jgi:pSer/pThr/pTyr-binding forkhead associated (FHA) protein
MPVPDPPTEVVPSETTAFTPDEVEAASARAVLTVDGRPFPVTTDVVAIGRSSGCDVVLDDPNVSRRHAELRLAGATPVVVDLGSTNGTIVNGRRVREQALAFGDRIVLGSTTLVLERPEG